MKLSTAMLKGYALVGRQWRGGYCKGDRVAPVAVCAVGAVNFALFGDARSERNDFHLGWGAFHDAYGMTAAAANDKEKLPIDVIAGMLKAIGH